MGCLRIIVIRAKCSDMFSYEVPHLDKKYQGYVPSDLGIGGGDYIEFSIDLNTGKIIGWQPLTDEELEKIA